MDSNPTSPAKLQATPTHGVDQMLIFDILNDPRKKPSDIEAFVLSDPTCLRAQHIGDGSTPLHEAARRGSSSLLQFFVDSGAILEVRDHDGGTPFLMACDSGSLYAVHTLVACGANPKVVDNKGRSAMHHAALIGAIHIMHYLAETQNLDFRAGDKEGNTPLHYAILKRHMDTMKYLLRNKRADRYAANGTGVTPLHLAVQQLNGPMVWFLLNTSSVHKMLCAKDKNGATPIGLAELGGTTKYKVLARKLDGWYVYPGSMKTLPWVVWWLFALLPALALILAPLLFSYFSQPFGFIVALLLAVLGFLLPMTLHRIPHDMAWQNPTAMTGLVAGVTASSFCYILMVFPRLWPSNAFVFFFGLFNSFIATLLFFKLKLTNPGHDKVGKIGPQGQPLTILDVAKQGQTSMEATEKSHDTHSSPSHYAFCTYCEIVIPDRTKHCKLCDACCNGFDHHCTWLTTCIGSNNHRLFVIFTFLLALDNFLFIYESYKLFSVLAQSSNIWTILVECFSSEHWIMILFICNTIAFLFSLTNFMSQINNISKLETTFFDISGKAAYNAPRVRKKFTVATRFHLIYLFFVDYKRWYNRPKQDVSTACYPKFTV